MLPPKEFDHPSVEAQFLSDYAKRFAANRRGALLIALFAWVLYSGWDILHAVKNTSFEAVLPYVGAARVAGAAALLYLAVRVDTAYFEDERRTTLLLCAGAGTAYALILLMIWVSPFPENYLFYFTGLILTLLFMVGLLRLRVRPLLWLLLFCLVISAFILPLATRIDAAKLLKDVGSVTSVELRSLSSYYFWSAVTYLVSFTLLGYLLAVDMEKSARAAFQREEELFLANRSAALSHQDLQLAFDDLEQSKRTSEARADALLAAKEELRLQAENENHNKSKFLADAAHDLRQPMQAVSSLLEAARVKIAKGDIESTADLVAKAQSASQLTRASFNAVLDISRLESGFVNADLAVFDLNELLAEILTAQDGFAAQHGVALKLRPASNHRRFVESDRHLLGRLLSNLISNAIKHRQPDKPGARVIVGVVAFANRLRIDVVDNGIGIAPDRWAEIFQPFVQLANSGRDRTKGLGLGLSIVNAIVPLLPEHRLDMRSNHGRGTRFSLEVPTREAEQTAESGSNIVMEDELDFAGVYALYVEDDILVRDATAALFHSCGLAHEPFASLAELEAALATFERAPDIVITDYRLDAQRTGREVIELVRDEYGDDIPVIVMTGEIAELEDDAWLGTGKILRKPISPERLLQFIQALALR